jgi:hypothetical protein
MHLQIQHVTGRSVSSGAFPGRYLRHLWTSVRHQFGAASDLPQLLALSRNFMI